MAGLVVCVSHEEGSDGAAIAALAAGELGLRYLDDEIVTDAAHGEGLLPEGVAAAEDRHAGRTLEVDFHRYERSERLRELIREAIVRAADEGDALIVSHAASYALAGRPGVLRVCVTAPERPRISRVAAREGLGEHDAAKHVAESDKGRATYLRRVYEVKDEEPQHYDLVLNSERLGVEAAAAAVVAAARAFVAGG